jgi:hypothetical protein
MPDVAPEVPDRQLFHICSGIPVLLPAKLKHISDPSLRARAGADIPARAGQAADGSAMTLHDSCDRGDGWDFWDG